MRFRLRPITPRQHRKKYITFYVPDQLYEQAVEYAHLSKVSLQELSKQALEYAVNELEAQRMKDV